MRNKPKCYSILLIGLVVFLLASSVISCASSEIDEYEDAIEPLLDEYKSVINDWEESANDPDRLPYLDLDAEAACSRMQNIIVSWDAIISPDEVREYHLWMRHAMDYEREAFRIMAEYYRLGEHTDPEEFDELRNMVVKLWILKDEALLKADAAFPNE